MKLLLRAFFALVILCGTSVALVAVDTATDDSPPVAEAASATGTIWNNHVLWPGEWLLSQNQQFFLMMQTDGNLVLYRNGGGALWASGTTGSNYAYMQDDGNLVVYRFTGGAAWHSYTYGNSQARLSMQDDGNLVIRRASDGYPLWSTNTWVRSYGQQMADLNYISQNASYANWVHNAQNGAYIGWKTYSYMIWENDRCSAPIYGDTVYDFYYPCARHDFGYRNLKRINDTIGGGVWNGHNKNAVDYQFKDDMYERCGQHVWYVQPQCWTWAEFYFTVVNAIPPWGCCGQGFHW